MKITAVRGNDVANTVKNFDKSGNRRQKYGVKRVDYLGLEFFDSRECRIDIRSVDFSKLYSIHVFVLFGSHEFRISDKNSHLWRFDYVVFDAGKSARLGSDNCNFMSLFNEF